LDENKWVNMWRLKKVKKKRRALYSPLLLRIATVNNPWRR